MGKPYSIDLRERVVGAVEREGLSRRRALGQILGTITVIPADDLDPKPISPAYQR